MAEFESRRISERTRDALAAAKARGVKLGGLRPGTLRHNTAAKERATREAEKLRGVLRPMAAAGLSLRDMAAALEGAGKTTKAGNQLSPTQVKRLLERLEIQVGER